MIHSAIFTLTLLFGLTLAPHGTHGEDQKPVTAPVRHCQVPCGIFADKMRVDMMMEDAITIEKAMGKIGEETKVGNFNQVVRWVNTKEEHAQAVQNLVADYWLAQRVKAPASADDATARAKYLEQLELMHGITVAAMKCKQTTDPAPVAVLRDKLLTFSKTYFKPEDLKHIESHHAGHQEHGK